MRLASILSVTYKSISAPHSHSFINDEHYVA